MKNNLCLEVKSVQFFGYEYKSQRQQEKKFDII